MALEAETSGRKHPDVVAGPFHLGNKMASKAPEFWQPVRGQTFVVRREVRAWKYEQDSQVLVRLQPGECVTFVNHGRGSGSDSLYVVTLQRGNGERCWVNVGWFNLSREDFSKEETHDGIKNLKDQVEKEQASR